MKAMIRRILGPGFVKPVERSQVVQVESKTSDKPINVARSGLREPVKEKLNGIPKQRGQ